MELLRLINSTLVVYSARLNIDDFYIILFLIDYMKSSLILLPIICILTRQPLISPVSFEETRAFISLISFI